MKISKLLSILLLFNLSSSTAAGQNELKLLESRLMQGDKSALFEIAPYFDNTEIVKEFLGYHILSTEQSQIAKRIINENCLFMKDEIEINKFTTARQFLDFLNLYEKKIVFSHFASAFLITPLEKRAVNFEVREISGLRKKELSENEIELFTPDWVKEHNIKLLVENKDPFVLLEIASELFKERSRFNRYYFNEKEFTDLLQFLTQTEIGVENEGEKISWHIDNDYYPDSKLNLLIYFTKFYSQYAWDSVQHIFKNPDISVNPIENEVLLFQLLDNENDSIALNAFIQLTILDPDRVNQLSDEYEDAIIPFNYSIPTFPYRFLKQLVRLTEYCRENAIDLEGSAKLNRDINTLMGKLSFSERREQEDSMINSMTLDDITAFEYHAILYEKSARLSYSSGRILDIFYSKHWNELLENKKYLDCYLKKSKLFNDLGIIGICNNYLKKFTGASPSVLEKLKNIQTEDNDIKEQAANVIAFKEQSIAKKQGITLWDGNYDDKVRRLKKKIDYLTTNVEDSSKTDSEISEILSKISYEQISIGLNGIEDYTFQSSWQKYSFMERDWGLYFIIGDFNKKEVREDFLNVYNTYSEYELYVYYLNQAGIKYKKPDSKLDYDKIFELIKYDAVVAFCGGGGGTLENEVYALIKLLELTFGTTLGYPRKFCSSNNIYSCHVDERVQAWMTFLMDKKLLQEPHDEPISFHR